MVIAYQHVVLVELRRFQNPRPGSDRRFNAVHRFVVFKLGRGDKAERARQGEFLQERIIGAFQGDLQFGFTQRFDVGDLVRQLQPGMALAVIKHRAEVLCCGLGVKCFAVREGYVIAQRKHPGFAICRVGPAFCQPGFY